MRGAEDHQMVQALGPDGAHEALGVGVEVRASGRQTHAGDAGVAEQTAEVGRERGAAVGDQVALGEQEAVEDVEEVAAICCIQAPWGSGTMPAMCAARVCSLITNSTCRRWRPRQVSASTVKKSAAASVLQCACRKRFQVSPGERRVSGDIPEASRTRWIVDRLTGDPSAARVPAMRVKPQVGLSDARARIRWRRWSRRSPRTPCSPRRLSNPMLPPAPASRGSAENSWPGSRAC